MHLEVAQPTMTNTTTQLQTVATTAQTRPPSLKRSHSDMRGSRPPSKWIDDEHYRTYVLRLPIGTNEEEIDQGLKREAEELGLKQLQLATNVESITSSLSAITIASEPTNQGSIMSHSTAPTSCSSSEHRPVTSPAKSDYMPLPVVTPSILSEMEKKRRNSGFRRGIRKMAGFSRKRKSFNPNSSSTLSSIGSGSMSDLGSIKASKEMDVGSIHSSPRSPPKSPSIKSNKSSGLWSNQLSTTGKSSYERDVHDLLIDHEALRRSMDCKETISLRTKQFEERQRVLAYQTDILSGISVSRNDVRAQKKEVHKRVLAEQMEKNEKAVEDMESRQLEEELKMLKEHETDKLKILARLRHMEAYCQTPSPPPTPIEATFPLSQSGSDRTSSSASVNRGSVDSNICLYMPERKITDRDYHNLAASYRERDAMTNLHASRINVLRGRQKRAVENFVLKKEREVEKTQQDQQHELDAVDLDFAKQEMQCRQELKERKRILERRWKIESMVTRARREKLTGLKHELLPDIIFADDDPNMAILALS